MIFIILLTKWYGEIQRGMKVRKGYYWVIGVPNIYQSRVASRITCLISPIPYLLLFFFLWGYIPLPHAFWSRENMEPLRSLVPRKTPVTHRAPVPLMPFGLLDTTYPWRTWDLVNSWRPWRTCTPNSPGTPCILYVVWSSIFPRKPWRSWTP